ncbi:hypothetical protein [Arthrobacter cryoconiti]|uniref:Uncharacterized protein n=1 Tax=Arthrobacter cryoconiti TaxID=748907 RepID=A0ABV8QZY3_9MICC|nr:hypothetical protein [Arthrobacter cryoconiti]MCC9068501.1 hypothetical protein [Arthrobacter cryoconiti]
MNISELSSTPVKKSRESLKTRLGIGSATIVTVGLLGVLGAGVASAAPDAGSLATTSTAASTAKAGGGHMNPIGIFVRVSATSKQALGDRAEKAATRLVEHTSRFAKLPANLQADITTEKNAVGADRITDAVKIKTTALAGGYGAVIQKKATEAQNEAAHPGNAGERALLRATTRTSNSGVDAQKIALKLSGNSTAFEKLPANFQSDVTALKNASPADADAQAAKIKSAAEAGEYGTKIQTTIKNIEAHKGGAAKKAAAGTHTS